MYSLAGGFQHPYVRCSRRVLANEGIRNRRFDPLPPAAADVPLSRRQTRTVIGHFSTSGKQFTEGDPISSFGAVNLDVNAAPTPFAQTAPAALLDDDNVLRQFLYWDTCRRVTNKRTVRWTFNHPDAWTDWRAVAWYGVPSTGPGGGQALVTTSAHWVGVSPITATPIDG